MSRGRQSGGHLVIRDPDGAATERDVVGDTCEEVIEAFALITALSVDPSALTSPVATPTPTPTPPPPPPTPPAPPPPRPPAPSLPPAPDSWSLSLSADAAIDSGLAPRLLLGIPVFLDLASPRSGLLAWTFRAGFERTSTGAFATGGATADFTWTVGLLEACPTRFTLGTLRLEPCLRAEAGVLEGAGGDILPVRDPKPPWLALGATTRAEWLFLGPIFLELDAGLRFPLIQTRYFFEPDTTVAQPPAVGWMASAGLGVRIL